MNAQSLQFHSTGAAQWDKTALHFHVNVFEDVAVGHWTPRNVRCIFPLIAEHRSWPIN